MCKSSCIALLIMAVVALRPPPTEASPFESGHSFSLNPRSANGDDAGNDDWALSQVDSEPSPAPILWEGFLWGNRHFKDVPRPVSMPIYFEDPFINTDLRLIYLWHDVPNGSELRGGEIQAIAAQIRVALTERLQFLAVKDGYSKVHTGITPDSDGWNDAAAGIKYALVVDHANDFILSAGMRWEWNNGTAFALQGNGDELSGFVSFAKQTCGWNFMGALNYRIPTNRNLGAQSVTWHLHADYELFPDFFPLVEINGIHWVSDGDRLPLSVEYLDVGNIGSAGASGRDFFSAGVGFRWHIHDNVSLGTTWEFPLESADENIQQSRATVNIIVGL